LYIVTVTLKLTRSVADIATNNIGPQY